MVQLGFAFLLRTIWCIMRAYDILPKDKKTCYSRHLPVTAVNRVSKLFLFTAFSNVAFMWWEICAEYSKTRANRLRELTAVQVQTTQSHKKPSRCSPRTLQLLLNFWVYVILTALLLVEYFWCTPTLDQNNKIYTFETLSIAFFFLVLSLLYLWYGIRVLAIVRAISQDKTALKKPITVIVARRTLVIMAVCVICFLAGGLCSIYQPLTGHSFPASMYHILYPWFVYPVPDLIPSVLVLFMLAPKNRLPRRTKDPSTPLLTRRRSARSLLTTVAKGSGV